MLPLRNQVPLLRLLIPFLAGILCFIYTPLRIPFWPIVLLIAIGFQLLWNIGYVRLSYRHKWLTGLVLYLSFFICGYQLVRYNTGIEYRSHFSHFFSPGNDIIAKIIEPPLEKEKSLKTPVEVLAVRQQGKWRPSSGNAIFYIERETTAISLRYGDIIVARPGFKSIDPPANPEEFNYKQYLRFHNISHQCYLSKNSWQPLHLNAGNVIIAKSIQLRDYFLDIFRKYKIEGDEFAVGSALILGYEDKLDPAIISAYSGSGALHVLSVSGLHIAIIYLVFLKLLFFLDRYKNGRVIKALLLVLMLWFYSCLTGLSPSVMRAATMFSFIIIGKALYRYTNIYNTLAASAFLLLLIDPFLVMEVGFQLSYLAVLGIVMLQPGIYDLWKTNNWLLNQVWSVTAVSIAAQVATFPLGLLYFHQFPNYFLLSNLVVIPISGLILYVGILLLVLAKVPFLGMAIAWFLSFLLKLLNASVVFFEKAPFSLIQGVSISIAETWLIYLSISGIFLFFLLKQNRYLFGSVMLFIVLLIYQVIERNKETQHNRLIVYSIKSKSAIDLVDGKRNYFLADSDLVNDKSAMLFHVYHNWWELGINEHEFPTHECKGGSFFRHRNFVLFRNKKLLIADTSLVLESRAGRAPFALDFIILSANVNKKVSQLLHYFNCNYFIIDSSNSPYRAAKWKAECRALKKECYDVMQNGALVLEI
jgi:competence protein ComEC